MEEERWAPVRRLQERYRAANDQPTRDVLDAAISREVNAIAMGRKVVGSLATLKANMRKIERDHAKLERRYTPLLEAANDPWPAVDRRITRDRVISLSRPPTRRTIELVLAGKTYEEAAAMLGEPVGTLKSRVSRARRKFA